MGIGDIIPFPFAASCLLSSVLCHLSSANKYAFFSDGDAPLKIKIDAESGFAWRPTFK